MHGLEVAQGVEQGLALGGGGGGDVEIQHVGGQALGGQFEGGAGAGAGLEEQIDDGLAAQQRHFLHGLLGDAAEGFGGVEDVGQQLPVQTFDGQEMAQVSLGVHLKVVDAHALRVVVNASGFGAGEFDVLLRTQIHVPANHVGLDRQFTAAAFHQYRQHDRGWAAVIEQFIERGADGAAGVQHVVDQDDVPVIDVERQVGRLHLRVHADAGEVVAVKGNVEAAERLLQFQQCMQALRDPDTAGVDADHAR